jgi:hypothetical protein
MSVRRDQIVDSLESSRPEEVGDDGLSDRRAVFEEFWFPIIGRLPGGDIGRTEADLSTGIHEHRRPVGEFDEGRVPMSDVEEMDEEPSPRASGLQRVEDQKREAQEENERAAP